MNESRLIRKPIQTTWMNSSSCPIRIKHDNLCHAMCFLLREGGFATTRFGSPAVLLIIMPSSNGSLNASSNTLNAKGKAAVVSVLMPSTSKASTYNATATPEVTPITIGMIIYPAMILTSWRHSSREGTRGSETTGMYSTFATS